MLQTGTNCDCNASFPSLKRQLHRECEQDLSLVVSHGLNLASFVPELCSFLSAVGHVHLLPSSGHGAH